MKDILLVGAGGFAGSILRYLISVAMISSLPAHGLPWHTLMINVGGSLLIGVIVSAEMPGGWNPLLMAGFCGGFTTFSTFSLEAIKLFRMGHTATAGAYIALSIVLSLAAVVLGLYVGTKLGT